MQAADAEHDTRASNAHGTCSRSRSKIAHKADLVLKLNPKFKLKPRQG